MATQTVGAMGPTEPSGLIPLALTGLGQMFGGIPRLVEGLPQAAVQTVGGAGEDIAKAGEAVGHALYSQQPTPAAAPAKTKAPPAIPPSPAAQANDSLSYQQLLNQVFGPLISSLGYGNQTSANQALPGYPNPPSAPQSAAQSIANTQQVMVKDYQTGLNAMLSTAAEQAPLSAIIKGMEEVLAYPQTGLTGLYGAPPGIIGNQTLQQAYENLLNVKGGLLPTNATGTADAGYNTNTLNAALQG